MQKKKILVLLLACVLIFLTGCGGYRKSGDITVIGDTESRDPLRICIDLEQLTAYDPQWTEKAWNDFLFRVKETAGIEEVVLEIIPPPMDWEGHSNAVARKAALARIRTEVMAGEGPDVFLMRYVPYTGFSGNDYDGTDFLFKYPEKAMENGLFLPLDELIENNAELAEWDKLTQPVLEAGRNKEGQQIIPLNYTFPLLCYPKSEWEHIPDKKYTWNDMLTNPELLPYSLDLANCGERITSYSMSSSGDIGEVSEEWMSHADYIHHLLGDIADFENETLAFTEEELLARVNEILALEQADAFEKVDGADEEYACPHISERKFNKPTTFLPLYSVDGGITAHIEKFAAVNRNTKRPEEAFKVIDLLMSKYMQRWGDLYNEVILSGGTLPMNEELFQESDPLVRDNYYMTAENFEAFCKVREQITGANFESEITAMLEEMMQKCIQIENYDTTVEEVVHETYEHMERRMKE